MEEIDIDAAYVRDLLSSLEAAPEIDVVSHELFGTRRDAELVLILRMPHCGLTPCLYGFRERIWEDQERQMAPDRVHLAVTVTYLQLLEMAATGMDLPATCAPDDNGVTWVDLCPSG